MACYTADTDSKASTQNEPITFILDTWACICLLLSKSS